MAPSISSRTRANVAPVFPGGSQVPICSCWSHTDVLRILGTAGTNVSGSPVVGLEPFWKSDRILRSLYSSSSPFEFALRIPNPARHRWFRVAVQSFRAWWAKGENKLNRSPCTPARRGKVAAAAPFLIVSVISPGGGLLGQVLAVIDLGRSRELGWRNGWVAKALEWRIL